MENVAKFHNIGKYCRFSKMDFRSDSRLQEIAKKAINTGLDHTVVSDVERNR